MIKFPIRDDAVDEVTANRREEASFVKHQIVCVRPTSAWRSQCRLKGTHDNTARWSIQRLHAAHNRSLPVQATDSLAVEGLLYDSAISRGQ